MAAWVGEEEKASENRWRMRKAAEEAGEGEVAPGVTVGSLRRFRVAMIGPIQGLPKRRRLRRKGSLRTIPDREYSVVHVI